MTRMEDVPSPIDVDDAGPCVGHPVVGELNDAVRGGEELGEPRGGRSFRHALAPGPAKEAQVGRDKWRW